MSTSSLKEDLARAATEVRETHVSWVFLTEREVFKVKKPVSFGFLDFSTLAARRAACEAEVQLNARLSPDVYLGVVPITRDAQGRHDFGGQGATADYAVHMRRLADADRADARLARGELGVAEIDAVATHIGAFHARTHTDPETTRYGSPEAIALNVRENFAETRAVIDELVDPREAREIEHWQLAFLERCADTLRARELGGHIRDGHGDLRLEHVYLERTGELRVIDCIEFDPRFRVADVAADIAFLSMDLAWHGRVDLAERLLATYARETSDFGIYSVIDFYESYRAFVRGKVATLLAADAGAPLDVRERALTEARRYFRLALAAERRPLLPPLVIAIGGGLATGKSTIADRVGALLGAPTINSDRLRKHMVGAQATDRLYEGTWSGAYDPAFTAKVYEAVAESAAHVVRSRRPVILDASFRSRSMRADARRLASRLGVRFLFVECRADEDVCRARLRERERGPSVSDGRLAIFDAFAASFEPVTELAPDEHIVIDTTHPIEECLDLIRARVPSWL